MQSGGTPPPNDPIAAAMRAAQKAAELARASAPKPPDAPASTPAAQPATQPAAQAGTGMTEAEIEAAMLAEMGDVAGAAQDITKDIQAAIAAPSAAAAAAAGAPVNASASAPAIPPGARPFKTPEFPVASFEGKKHELALLRDVNLKVRIELGRTRMFVEDVLRLDQGAVVELDKLAGDPVDVYVNDRHVARGEVLVLNDNFCVRISEILDPTSDGSKA
jgi:flagellar motor switch protein FliN/FliY